MILIKYRCDLLAIKTKRKQSFFVIMSGNMQNKHVGSTKRASKSARVGIHTTTSIGLTTLKWTETRSYNNSLNAFKRNYSIKIVNVFQNYLEG